MKLVIVVPCYNEEEVLAETRKRLIDVLKNLEDRKKIDRGQILFVDDGSRDHTWQLIEQFAKETPMVGGLKLSCNRGHQFALWAGLRWAAENSDASVSIDADLQDDVNAIYDMVDAWLDGNDIVYGVRRERKTDTFFKRNTALAFYRLMTALGGKIIYNHADFRLMSRRAMQSLMQYPEDNLFLRGIVASIGYPSASVYYDRSERFAGESKYPLKKMLAFALEGITSFSVKPLRVITYLGLLFILVALGVIAYALYEHFAGQFRFDTFYKQIAAAYGI
jgi:polyisoprenyl-phosphate glycosyltransferase